MSDGFPAAAREALGDAQLRRNLRKATHTIRDKRARAVEEVGEWEALREAGRAIKDHTMRHLDVHLEALERSISASGKGAWAPSMRLRISRCAGV